MKRKISFVKNIKPQHRNEWKHQNKKWKENYIKEQEGKEK
jgi:hypothetical protein